MNQIQRSVLGAGYHDSHLDIIFEDWRSLHNLFYSSHRAALGKPGPNPQTIAKNCWRAGSESQSDPAIDHVEWIEVALIMLVNNVLRGG